MLNKKQKNLYLLIGSALGVIAGIYQLTAKEILRHEVKNFSASSGSDLRSSPKAEIREAKGAPEASIEEEEEASIEEEEEVEVEVEVEVEEEEEV